MGLGMTSTKCDEIRRLLLEAYAKNTELVKERLAQSTELLMVLGDKVALGDLEKRVAVTEQALSVSFEKIERLSQRLFECESTNNLPS
jgi:hypothetical protein